MRKQVDTEEKLKEILEEMTTLEKEVENDRATWFANIQTAYGFYALDRTVIFGNDALSDDTRQADPTSRSQCIIPVVRDRVNAGVSVTTNNIKFRVIPRLEQDDEKTDLIVRTMNAAFEAYRSYIGMQETVVAAHRLLFITDRCYLRPCLDYVKTFPRPIPSLEYLTPMQVFSEPGKRFNKSRKVVVHYWIPKSELKAQYPDRADEIDKLVTVGDAKTGKRNFYSQSGSSLSGNTVNFANQEPSLQSEALLVRERWKFDAQLDDYPKADCRAALEKERALIEEFIKTGTPPPRDMVFNIYQYHDQHLAAHIEHETDIRKRLQAQEMITVQNPVDMVVTSGPALKERDPVRRQRMEMAVQLLQAHEERHRRAMNDIGFDRIGLVPKYEGGWRQSIILGDKIIAYDGTSQYRQFGINGCPIRELEQNFDALHAWTVSYAYSQVDYQKIVQSTLNSMLDNYRMFGSHDRMVEKGVAISEDYRPSNDPAVDTVVPDNTLLGGQGRIMDRTAKEIPSSAFNLINMVRGMSQESGGIYGSILGQRQTGVRSAEHEQFLGGENRAVLDNYKKHMEQTWQEVGLMLFKMILKVPPDDNYVKTVLDNRVIKVDYEMLSKLDFTVEVELVTTDKPSFEARQQMTLGLTQNAFPIFEKYGMASTLLKHMGKSIKTDMPDLSQDLIDAGRQMEQREAAMAEQQAALAAQGGMPPGTPGATQQNSAQTRSKGGQ